MIANYIANRIAVTIANRIANYNSDTKNKKLRSWSDARATDQHLSFNAMRLLRVHGWANSYLVARRPMLSVRGGAERNISVPGCVGKWAWAGGPCLSVCLSACSGWVAAGWPLQV